MASLGFITLNKNSERSYFTELANRAYANNLECFRFVPSDINPTTEKVSGDYFNHKKGKWEPLVFPIPNVLYDRCFYGEDQHSKQCMAIVNWLKSRGDINFLGYGLPNKLELYKVLEKSRLSPYLPKSEPITTNKSLIEMLSQQNPLIIKPVSGSQGQGIYYLEMIGKDIHVHIDKQNKQISHIFTDHLKAIAWLNQLTKKRNYLVQPYLDLSNNVNQPFDIRILLQKDINGEWREMGRGIRTGKTGGIISNLSAGGTMTTFEDWLDSVSTAQQEYIREELDDILNSVPPILEKELLPLFELGIDIGVGKDGSVWILDVNSKPGRKLILNTCPEGQEQLYTAPLLYGKTLIAAEEKVRRMSNEKTISN